MSRQRKPAAHLRRAARHAASRRRPQRQHAAHLAYEARMTKVGDARPQRGHGKASRRGKGRNGANALARVVERQKAKARGRGK